MDDHWKIPQANFRLHRARALAAAILAEIQDLLPDDILDEAHARLVETLHRNGAAWTTEDERLRMGFPARDEKGWTQDENSQARRAMLDLMTRPISHHIRTKDVKG